MGEKKPAFTLLTIISVLAVTGAVVAAPADGTYSGHTSQGKAISLTVSGGNITGYQISWSCGATSGNTNVGTTCGISSNSFSCGSSSCPGAPYTTSIRISGTFAGDGSVSGSFDLSYKTGITGGCCSLGGITYTAQGSGGSTPVLSIDDDIVVEGDTGSNTADLLVTLSPAASQTVTVDWATSDGTATSGDYASDSGTLTFPAGQTGKTISVVVYGDTVVEGNEFFNVNLSNASNADISDGQGRCTITDDDTGGSTPQLDIIVPAAARGAGSGGSVWLTRLYIRNTGTSRASVTLYWLERGEPNESPRSASLSIGAGDTAVLDDVILDSFAMSSAGGAIGIAANQPLVASAAILNTAGGTEFGQGFEGIPVSQAITSGNSSSTVGLKHNDDFRTNVYLIDTTGSGSSATVNILDTNGNVTASRDYSLGAYMPRLDSLDTFGKATLDDGAMEIVVTSGSVIGGASRVNRSSGDPITLKVPGMVTTTGSCDGIDGTYQFALYDSLSWATGGGNLVISNGELTDVDLTYSNLDHEIESCRSIFFDVEANYPTGADYTNFAFITQIYGGGELLLEFDLTHNGNTGLTGTVNATGSQFTGDESACNSAFPVLNFRGGRE